MTKSHSDRATIDFETRSACDIKTRGAWLYARHPTTDLICLSYLLPGMKEPALWHRAYPEFPESDPPSDLFDWIRAGGLIEAHNAFFEMCIWAHVAVPKYGWPETIIEQWRCSAAKAAAHALPRSLAGAANAMRLDQHKDSSGVNLIKQYCLPKKIFAADMAIGIKADAIVFNEDSGITRLWNYCRQDVRTEHALSLALADLSPAEQELWRITQDMNWRGVRIDVDLAKAAIALAREAKRTADQELFDMTGIFSGGQRALIQEWLSDTQLIDLPDTRAATIEWYLDHVGLTPLARDVLKNIKETNRSSTKKYTRMLECVDTDDNRARELMVYCGAERTGRFSSRSIQIHNMPRGKLKTSMEEACENIKTKDLMWCRENYGDVMNLLASAIRGAIVASPGYDLISADYSAIEARCLLWEAGAVKALDVFRSGGDIYCDMASGIYGRPVTKKNTEERGFGKVAILGLGYGMGFLKFFLTLRSYKISFTRDQVIAIMGVHKLQEYETKAWNRLFPKQRDDEDDDDFKLRLAESKIRRRQLEMAREDITHITHELALCLYVVERYRTRYPEVPQMWKDQEAAAIEAVKSGRQIPCGVVTWKDEGDFLQCVLPSGRALHYAFPILKDVKTSWGEVRPSLRFYGIGQVTKQWDRQATYSGKLVENITQAIARDILAAAKRSLANHPTYKLLLSVHDEIIVEVKEGEGDLKEFEKIMSTMPPEFDGCPITAEAKRYKRFQK